MASQALVIPDLVSQPVPQLGRSNSGAVITQIRADHNLPFDQTTKGLAVNVSSDIWNAQGQSGAINVYVKRQDGSYVKAKILNTQFRGKILLFLGRQ